MPTSCFEALQVWLKARALRADVYGVTSGGAFTRDFGLGDQVGPAAVSVMSNFAEGFGRNTRPESARFLTIAGGSLGEVRSQLYVAGDLGYIPDGELAALPADRIEIKRMNVSLRKSLGA